MKNITEEEKNLWLSNSQPKNISITISKDGEYINLGNSDIVSESLEITQILESGKTLSFGDVNASSLKFRCRDLAQDVRGCPIMVNLSFKDFPQYSQYVFAGRIDTQSNQTHEDVITTITAYDYLKMAFELDLTEWWKNLQVADNQPFAVYVDLISRKLASDGGVAPFDSSSLSKMANLNQIIATKPDLVSDYVNISGEMLLKWIAQVCNVYITLDRGRLKAVKLPLMGEGLHPHIGLHPKNGLYPSAGTFDFSIPKGEYITATYEPYKTEKIDQVIITDKGGIAEGQYPIQEGKNALYLDGNPFLWAMNMMECAEVIYNRVKDVFFTPCNIKCQGTVFMELGDVVRLSTVKNVIHTYILKRTMKGINSIIDTFTNKSEQYQGSHAPHYTDVTDLQTQSILRIKADIVELNKLVAADIDASRIKTGTLDASKVTIQNLTVTNSMISGQISTDHLASNVITTNNFKSQEIDAGQIKAGTISADRISGGTLNANNISVSNLSFGKISGSIGSGQISADVFSGRTVKCQTLYSTGGRLQLAGYNCGIENLEVYCRRHNANGTYSTFWSSRRWVNSQDR